MSVVVSISKRWVIKITTTSKPMRCWLSNEEIVKALEDHKTIDIVRPGTDQFAVIVNGDIVWIDMEEGK